VHASLVLRPSVFSYTSRLSQSLRTRSTLPTSIYEIPKTNVSGSLLDTHIEDLATSM
jgi:hypothetical protein